jgi:hypothetical protein
MICLDDLDGLNGKYHKARNLSDTDTWLVSERILAARVAFEIVQRIYGLLFCTGEQQIQLGTEQKQLQYRKRLQVGIWATSRQG